MAKYNFEDFSDAEDYARKCMECKHSYTRRDEADVLFCRCKKGCNFEKAKEVKKNE